MKNKAYEYARAVVNKKIPAPKYVIKQCKLFLKIAEDKDKKYVINNSKVNQIEAILKILIMPKGLKAGQSIYECSCGYHEDRDVHAARNMIEIAKSCFEDGFVPTEHREVTLMEFKAAVADEILGCKSGQRSEKITPFKV